MNENEIKLKNNAILHKDKIITNFIKYINLLVIEISRFSLFSFFL